ncbi:MAG: hypothetical protein WC717_00765 [Candidatus Micrarchaeia archaeon]|jgi:hypothetical protein
MLKLIALLSLVALLFGCIGGVSQEKYDGLAASCEKAKQDAKASLAAEEAKTLASNSRLSECASDKQELEQVLTEKEQENGELRADAAVLAAARAKMVMAAQYNLTMEYYMEAFGPGKVPNTVRLKKIDAQAASLQDGALLSLWQHVKACQGITGCEEAKADFVSYINGKMASLAAEAAAIVGAEPG